MPRFFILVAGLSSTLVACGPGPTIVPAPRLHASAPVATTTTTTPPAQTSATVSPVQPKPVEVAAAAPLTVPPAPAIPPRTCPTLPNVSAAASGPRSGRSIVVTVSDYLSLAPIPGVIVDIHHGDVCTRGQPGGCRPSHPHPADQLHMTATTDAKGQAGFRVPDLDYGMHIPEKNVIPGYLAFSSIYNLGKQTCHELLIEKPGPDGRTVAYDAYLIPETMRAIRTNEDALAAAKQNQELMSWLSEHQDAEMTIRDDKTMWNVGFGYDKRLNRSVQINAFDGSSFLLGRWN